MRLVLLLLLTGTLTGCATSPALSPDVSSTAAPPAAAGSLSSNDLQIDLTALYEGLQSAHYDLFAHRTRAEYDAMYSVTMHAIGSASSVLDAVRLFQPFVAYGRVGHARLDFPVAEYIAAARRQERILPLDLRFVNGRAFVTHNYSAEPRLGPGTEIVSLNGRSILEVRQAVGRYVSAEREYFIDAQLEEFFPRWLWLDCGDVAEFTLHVLYGGGPAVVTVPAMPIGDAEPLKSAWTTPPHQRELRLLEDGVAWLRPGPFYNTGTGDAMDTTAFHAFVDDAFTRILAAGAESLIIDLRNNPGGDNSFSDHLIAWFADRPFRFSDDFRIRSSPQLLEAYQPKEGDEGETIIRRMYEAARRHQPGETFRFELPHEQPRTGARFSGRVFVLVNRHSHSNSASMAALIQDYRFGTILGEETADLPTSYASSMHFTLPRTGIAVTYPKGYFVRPSGDRSLRGVVPNLAIESPRPGAETGDLVLDKAIEIVRRR